MFDSCHVVIKGFRQHLILLSSPNHRTHLSSQQYLPAIIVKLSANFGTLLSWNPPTTARKYEGVNPSESYRMCQHDEMMQQNFVYFYFYLFSIFIQIKKKTLCGKVKEDEILFQRKRSASLSPDLFKLGIKNSTLDTKKIKEDFLGSTVSKWNRYNFFLSHLPLPD